MSGSMVGKDRVAMGMIMADSGWLVAIQGFKASAVHGWWLFLTFSSLPSQNEDPRETVTWPCVHLFIHSLTLGLA